MLLAVLRDPPIRLLLLTCLMLTISCGDRPAVDPTLQRKVELERRLREDNDEQLHAAAVEYRELMGEHPDALREVAFAYGLRSNRQAQFQVLRTLVARGQSTLAERLKMLELAHQLGLIDDALYPVGLTWLQQALQQNPWCHTFAQLVEWTEGRPEYAGALEQALAGCPRDYDRASWYAARASLPSGRGADDACWAVVHGDFALARTCSDTGPNGWRKEVAKALLGEDRLARLLAAARDPEVTVFVLEQLITTPGAPATEVCSALDNAQKLKTSWVPLAGDVEGVRAFYSAFRRGTTCD